MTDHQPSTRAAPRSSRPNVVLINCDDLGYGDLGCYGSTRNRTPTLDRLAAEGVRLESFYQASPVCSPSRGAMLTGCYPPRIGFGSFDGFPVLFPGQGVGLAQTERTLARVLGDAGYRTQMVGKWHCGDQPGFLPVDHGFEHYFGIPFSNDMGRQADTPSFFPPQHPLPLLLDGDVIEQQPDLAGLTERYVTEAVRFLRAADDRPFFLYFAHMYVHLPIYVQERFARASSNGRYGAAVECIDWAAAVLLHELERMGVADDTIVVFTSDNGSLGDQRPPIGGSTEPVGGSNAPLRGYKASTWEGGQRVPCIIRWPGRVPAGRVAAGVATAMDLLPTLAAACDAPLPADRIIDGRDLLPMLAADAGSPHDAFYFYWMNDLEAVRAGRWKLHFSKRGTEVHELYDLDTDPGEAHDVWASHPDVVAELDALAERARAELGDARLARTGAGVRAIGRVADPRPLTSYDPDHPYLMAEYDLADRG